MSDPFHEAKQALALAEAQRQHWLARHLFLSKSDGCDLIPGDYPMNGES